MNTIYLGDCLEVLRDNIPDESVDLIYKLPKVNITFKAAQLKGKKKKNQIKLDM